MCVIGTVNFYEPKKRRKQNAMRKQKRSANFHVESVPERVSYRTRRREELVGYMKQTDIQYIVLFRCCEKAGKLDGYVRE